MNHPIQDLVESLGPGRPGWTKGVGQRSKFTFFRIWSCCMSN